MTTLLESFINDWDVESLNQQCDELLESYRSVAQSWVLMEAKSTRVSKNLPDNLIKKVAEIEKRLEAIGKARKAVNKLAQMHRDDLKAAAEGKRNPNKRARGFNDKEAKKHRDRFTKYKRDLQKLLDETMPLVQELQQKVDIEVDELEQTTDNLGAMVDEPETVEEPKTVEEPAPEAEADLTDAERRLLLRVDQGKIDFDNILNLPEEIAAMLDDLDDRGYFEDDGETLSQKAKEAIGRTGPRKRANRGASIDDMTALDLD
jgi:hypothetical protein